MTSSSSSAMVQLPQLSLLDKSITFASWVLAGAIFLSVGWLAMEPDDPLGPVGFFARGDTIGMLVQVLALGGAAAAIATVLAGRLLADVGTFATALAIAAVSLRGGTAEAVLLDSPSHRALAMRMIPETILWLVVFLVVMLVSALVTRWLFGKGRRSGWTLDSRAAVASALAAYDVPIYGQRLFGVPAGEQTAPLIGAKHTIIMTALGLVVIGVLSAGLSSRSIQHGQVCFVIAAGVCISAYLSYRIMPVHSALWSILAVALMALLAYLWAAVCPAQAHLPANMPPSHFLRMLPVQFLSVGTVAAVATFWQMYAPPSGETDDNGTQHGGSMQRGGR